MLLNYECIGPEDAPVLFLSPGLGGLAAYWKPQLEAYAADHRVVLMDQRGTGRNREELPDGLTMADMADDALDVLDAMGVTSCRFVGHAIGGSIGMTMALKRPGLIERMVVVNSWIRTNPHTIRCFQVRLDLLDHVGVEAFVRAQPIFLLPSNWMAANPERLAHEHAAGVAHFQGAANFHRRVGAAKAFDISDHVGTIQTPVLVVAAHDDVLVPSDCSVALAAALPNARLAMQPYGGHSCNVVEPDAFTALTVPFLLGP